MGDCAMVSAAVFAFVGTRFLLSHPLRKPLVAALGNAVFLGVYSIVAAVTLVRLALAYRAAPTTPQFRPTPAPSEARGVYPITRHPMMWAFAI